MAKSTHVYYAAHYKSKSGRWVPCYTVFGRYSIQNESFSDLQEAISFNRKWRKQKRKPAWGKVRITKVVVETICRRSRTILQG